jgi:hypothetical protein
MKGRGRGLILLMAVLSIALSGCGGGSSSTSSSTPNDGSGATDNGTTGGGAGSSTGVTDGGVLNGAATALGKINSYQFQMTLAGGSFSSTLGALGGATATGSTAMDVKGTIILKPAQAADVTVMGMHIIEIGGYSYMDLGTGQFMKTKSTGTSLADSFSPSTMFSGSMTSATDSGYDKVGSESKNGVQTDHYQASAATLAVIASGLSSDVGGATVTWSSDVWIATPGGYPVSYSMVAKTSDGTVVYEVSFDLSHINDSSNSVTAPTNVMGI